MNYFFTSLNKPLFRSLERYFRYRLDERLTLLEDGCMENDQDACVFVLKEEKFDSNFLEIILIYRIANIVVMGFEEGGRVNLADTSRLAVQLWAVLSSDQNASPFTASELEEKIRSFFKGHGEQSLTGCLGEVSYFFENYKKMVSDRGYEPAGLNSIFFEPGLKNWNKFLRRLDKYALVLCVAGKASEIKAIEDYVASINNDLNCFTKPDSFYIFDERTLQGLREITKIMEEMARKAGLSYEKPQPPGN